VIAAVVGLGVLAASARMVYALEILKARHLRAIGLGRFVRDTGAEDAPPVSDDEREAAVERAITAR
jgi:hypothetical protein